MPLNSKKLLDLHYPTSFEDLPEVGGDVESVFAEVGVQRALFGIGRGEPAQENMVDLATFALRARCADKTLEDRLATFSLAYSLGDIRCYLIPHKWSRATRWSRRAQEDIIIGWMRWVAWDDTDPMSTALARIERDVDNTIEALAIRYWAVALNGLVQNDQELARRYFEKAMDVSSQFGFSSNPSICWTYAVSFLYQGPLACV